MLHLSKPLGRSLLTTGILGLLAMCTPSLSFAAPATFDITKYGAVADGKTMNSKAIADAVDAAVAAGGGEVLVPAGNFLTGPVQLKSNIDLYLDEGATLLFSKNFADYPLCYVDNGGGAEPGVRSPIWAEKADHVSVTGKGTIDGQGSVWRQVKRGKMTDEEWNKLTSSGGVVDSKGTMWYPDVVVRDGRVEYENLLKQTPQPPLADFEKFRVMLRPHLVRLVECTNVELAGVTFRESGAWNTHLCMCDHVNMHDVTIYNPASAQNGDGCDLDSCTDVKMTNCNVNAGDDGICIKSGLNEAGRKRGRPTQDVTITHCTVGTGHGGVVIGSETSGSVRNITVTDCTFDGTQNGLRFKSTRGRGGVVENINVDHITMRNIHEVGILFDMFYALTSANGSRSADAVPVDDGTPIFRNFHISNVTCESADTAFHIRGLPEMPLTDIHFDGMNITANKAGFIQDAKNLTLKGVHVKSADGKQVTFKRATEIKVEDSTGFGPVDAAAAN